MLDQCFAASIGRRKCPDGIKWKLEKPNSLSDVGLEAHVAKMSND